ncbi:unnamed protein product [Calypogeia fissa]
MKSQCSQFVLSLLILVVIREAAAIPNLRGVAPKDERYYQTAIIKCKDGSKSFPQERLNDDFCDCADGTDEPGTNACPEGKFYCKNLGHKPLVLFSSRVNDGICDCCDGSDEYDGKVQCPNTCRESGKQSIEKLKKKLTTFKDGSVLRTRDVENAKRQREGFEAELGQLKKEEKSLKDIVSKLKVEKEAVEKQEQEEKERETRVKEEQEKRDKAEQERREKETATEKETAGEDEKPQRAEEAPSEVEVPSESPTEEDTAPLDVEDLLADDEGLDHLTAAERGRVIASRWTGEDVSDILSSHEAASEDLSEDDDLEEEDVSLMHENDEDDDYEPNHLPSPSGGYAALSPEVTDSGRSSWWSQLSAIPDYFLRLVGLNRPPVDKSEAERIRKEYQEAYDKLQGIERKISDIEKRNEQDFGKEGEFYGFYDRCFELKDKKYTYNVCPYKDATQVESYSTSRLGRWQGFKEDYKEMMFENGDRCWNGPERSLRVKMRCGTKLELRSVDEPSRCEYVGEFSTPALCLPSKVQVLEQQLLQNDPESMPSHDEL